MGVFEAVLLGVVGWLAGIMVNVLADYLPDLQLHVPEGQERPTRPLYPHYPDGSRRPWLVWSGLVAFLTGKRVSAGGVLLAWRHPVVEVLHLAAYPLITLRFGMGVQGMFYLVIFSLLVLISVIDIEHRLVLVAVMIPAWLLAVLESYLAPVPPPILKDALIGGAVGFGLFYVMFVGGIIFSRVTRTGEIAFGFGDVMLGTLSGLLLGWRPIFIALFLTVFLGAAGSLLYLLSRALVRRRYSLFTALPYGPYIVLATLMVMLWRDEIRALLWR